MDCGTVNPDLSGSVADGHARSEEVHGEGLLGLEALAPALGLDRPVEPGRANLPADALYGFNRRRHDIVVDYFRCANLVRGFGAGAHGPGFRLYPVSWLGGGAFL